MTQASRGSRPDRATFEDLRAAVRDEEAFGTMVALKGDVIDLVPLGEAVTELKTVRPSFLDEAALFFG